MRTSTSTSPSPALLPALAPGFVLAGMADKSDVDVCLALDVPEVAPDAVLVPCAVLVTVAVGDGLGEGVDDEKPDLDPVPGRDRVDCRTTTAPPPAP